ncbi:MAG: DNA polymerase III subunit gamma/tau [Sphingobacteriales bacterium]|nr:MAG: DNA polymerase III subunit gamma/tau [Sphingobacteriales bacterium]
MDKFIVSARKYRPQNFNTVVGQSHITTTLKNAINNNQLAHAFLFCGPRGVGKTTCARILAKTINCETKTADGEACNTCNSCVSFDAGTSLNIHELDAASNNSVDDIRALVEQVRFAPQAGEYKVYIVDEVHMLSAAAFNAFLKTLEEPPPYAIFILATTEKHKILPTILSRCQIFDFKRITNNDTVEHLQEICGKEDITAEKTALHIIAQKSEGCMRDSLSILDKIVSFTDGKLTYANTLEHLNILDEDYYFKLLEHLQNQQLSDALLLLDNILQKGFEADSFVEGFTEFSRNLLVSKDTKAVSLLEVADDFKEKYVSWAQKTDTGWILATLNLLSDANVGFKTARNKKLFTEMLLIKLSYLQQAIEVQQGETGLGKKKLTDNAKPVAFRALPGIRLQNDSKPAIAKQAPAPQEASLTIEKPVEKIIKPAAVSAVPSAAPVTTSAPLGSLKKLREKIAQQNNVPGVESIALTAEKLKDAWTEYIEILRNNKNHSSVTIFGMAKLKVVDNDSFEITVDNTMQQKFVEVERAGLIEHFTKKFRNRALTYQLLIDENAVQDETPVQVLSSKQKFLMMAEQYPNIQLLKEKLRLDIG